MNRLLSIFMAVALLAGCDPAPSLYDVNNSGASVEVLDAETSYTFSGSARSNTWDRWWPLSIRPGQRREVMHMISGDPQAKWIVRFRRGGCTWTQEIPNRIGEVYYSEAWEAFPAEAHETILNRVLQIQPDGALYVVPPGSLGPTDIPAVANIQPSGFPLRAPQTCEGDSQ